MANKLWVGGDAGGAGDYSIAANWSPVNVPVAADDVRIPIGNTNHINAGLNQSAVALNSFIVEDGATVQLGTSSAYLQIGTSSFHYGGDGTSRIDLGASAVSPVITATASGLTGEFGLRLKGSAMAVLDVRGGTVGVAVKQGETSTLTTLRVTGATAAVTLGTGVTVTNVYCQRGTALVRCACTTLHVYGGTLTTEGTGAITTAIVYGGTFYTSATGTITTLTLNGGVADFTRGGVARTVTTLQQNPGSVQSSGSQPGAAGSTLKYDPAVLTITTRSAPNAPTSFIASAAAA